METAMSPNPDSTPTKHRGTRAKALRRASRPDGKLAGAKLYPHPKPTDPSELATQEERIRVAAYLRAERRGFAPGHEVEDWLAAEIEVDQWVSLETPPPSLTE